MPVPVWDISDEALLDDPLNSVISDDIWKKFDLDEPLEISYNHNNSGSSNIDDRTMKSMMMYSNEYDYTTSVVTRPETFDKRAYLRDIRHHDCMWAGLCISKEHNRTLPAKMDNQMTNRKIPAGRSLLISSRSSGPLPSATCQQQQQQTQQQQQQQQQIHQQQMQQSHPQRRKVSLQSDGDSTRPETPQISESETDNESEESDDDDEDDEDYEIEENSLENSPEDMAARRRMLKQHEIKREQLDDGPLVFRHDQISINDKLTECMSVNNNAKPKSANVRKVAGQTVRNYQQSNRIKVEDDYNDHKIRGIRNGQQQQLHSNVHVKEEPDNWNTLSDHCYHQPSSKKLDHLGVQTPSDSEEEIDVVTFEKPCRPAVLPTYPSIADRQHFQLTVNSALKEKPTPAPRPRGRPPSNGTPRKRTAQQSTKPAKRPRHKSYQRRSKVTKNCPPTPAASPSKTSTDMSRSCTSDDEPDTEKRSLHNNMERQRRIELRNAFEDLRVLVPEVEAKEKAPKVAILRQAAVYCDMLTEIEQVTLARVTEMKKRQERLRARLSQLRRSLASTR